MGPPRRYFEQRKTSCKVETRCGDTVEEHTSKEHGSGDLAGMGSDDRGHHDMFESVLPA